MTVQPLTTDTAKFDLVLNLGEQREPDGAPAGLSGMLQYATELFDRDTVEALGRRFIDLLVAAVADPEQAIGRLDILTARERRTILCEWNDTARTIGPVTLMAMLSEQVAQTPEAHAVVLEQQSLTYGQLDARANQLAHHLRELGVGAESVVGTLCPALVRHADRITWHPQGRRGLCPA